MAKTATKVQVSSVTGLTPTQERACSLLASGAKTAEVAQKLDVPGENSIPLAETNYLCMLLQQTAQRNKERSSTKPVWFDG